MKAKKTLLIVDDDIAHRTMLRILLDWQYDIFEADDGSTAIELAVQRDFDLILMDIRLPGENGLKLTRKIKDLYPEIVVIIFTSHDLPEYRKAAFENGAEFFLSKSSRIGGRLTAVVESVMADH